MWRKGSSAERTSDLRPQISVTSSGSVLLSYLADRGDFHIRAEFLVVAIGDVFGDIQAFQECHAGVKFQGDVFRKPDFVVNLGLFDLDIRALVQANQKQAD